MFVLVFDPLCLEVLTVAKSSLEMCTSLLLFTISTFSYMYANTS